MTSNGLASDVGRTYPVEEGIADLFDMVSADDNVIHEMNAFESEVPIENVCYFRAPLFNETISILKHFLPNQKTQYNFVEIGGGEGYLAKAFLHAFPKSRAYVSDISMRHLRNAPPSLIRIRCDARKPYLAPRSMDIASFWVSLHHFSQAGMFVALQRTVEMIAPDGFLLLFEPNHLFLPRQILLHSPLKRLVYFDEEEKAIDYLRIRGFLKAKGFKEIYLKGVNPPYNKAFLKRLKLWPLLYGITESLFLLARFCQSKPLVNRKGTSNGTLVMGSYFFSLLRAKTMR